MQKNHYSQTETPVFSKFFGNLADGNEVLLFTLCNKNGAELSVMNYGATITSLKIPISETKKVDVVLGFDTLEDYLYSFDLASAPYFGTTVGRFAGRINNAKFSLNETQIHLNKNHGNHNIHGGNSGFSRKFWKVISTSNTDNPSITFRYESENNEENFPGELAINVTYTLSDNNELIVEYSAISTEDTIVNCTQHSYFNLDGQADAVTNQTLFVNSKQILETTLENIPTGNFVNLNDHKFDFSIPKKGPNQIDNTFVLENNDEVKASLLSEKNKLKMSVFTNQPAVHIYVGGNCSNQIKGKENTNYHAQSGICFETQKYPDAPNHSHFPSAVLKKGETYHQKTTFKFENILL